MNTLQAVTDPILDRAQLRRLTYQGLKHRQQELEQMGYLHWSRLLDEKLQTGKGDWTEFSKLEADLDVYGGRQVHDVLNEIRQLVGMVEQDILQNPRKPNKSGRRHVRDRAQKARLTEVLRELEPQGVQPGYQVGDAWQVLYPNIQIMEMRSALSQPPFEFWDRLCF